MPSFSLPSQNKLLTCDLRLQEIMNIVVKIIDITIIYGHRGEEIQAVLFKKGASKVLYPNSKHNSLPSKAVDIAPWPIEWQNEQRFIYMAGIVKGVAEMLGYKLRWGGDWDSDTFLRDNEFNDLGHFEVED